jgi:autophagy-related protein 9
VQKVYPPTFRLIPLPLQEYHKNPSHVGGRQYTPFAQWKFREFNELPHLFKRRLHESYPAASEYIEQFPNEKLALVMK